MNKKTLRNLAVFIALLFHVSGLIGILFTSYKGWFINNTYINLLLMTSLLIITHQKKNKNFYLLFLIVCITGFAIEVLGVNTGLIFGNYSYGNVLQVKLWNVPLLIGINWFIIIYCTGIATQVYENFILKRMSEKGVIMNNQIKLVSFIIDASILAVMYDWIMEPVAVKLGYWQWEGGKIPLYNYISWIIISALLLAVFRKLNKDNRQHIRGYICL